jgi:hypothetical protein
VDARRPIAIKLLAAMAVIFVLFTVVSLGGALYRTIKTGVPLVDLATAAKLVDFLLWLGLLVAIWRQSRIAVVLSVALLGKACVILYLMRSVFDALSSDQMVQVGMVVAALTFLVPAAFVEATFRLWRQGKLR